MACGLARVAWLFISLFAMLSTVGSRLFLLPKHYRVRMKLLLRSVSSLHPSSFCSDLQAKPLRVCAVAYTIRSSGMKGARRTVVLIDETGKNIGEKTLTEALGIARKKSLDLVSVNKEDKTVSPTYKLMSPDERNRRDKAVPAKTKQVSVSDRIEPRDLNFRIKRILKYLEKGLRVQFSVTSKRKKESKYEDKVNVINKVQQQVTEVGEMEGNLEEVNSDVLVCTFKPIASNSKRDP